MQGQGTSKDTGQRSADSWILPAAGGRNTAAAELVEGLTKVDAEARRPAAGIAILDSKRAQLGRLKAATLGPAEFLANG